MDIERRIKKVNGAYIDEIFLVKGSSIAYMNTVSSAYVFDTISGNMIKNKKMEKEVLRSIRKYLYR